MESVQVSEDQNGWTFRFTEGLVTQIRVDYSFTLVLDDARIVIAEPFELRTQGESVVVPSSDQVWDVGAALHLFNARVSDVLAARSGVLSVRFEEGSTIEVGPEPTGSFENWQIFLPGDHVWVGIPGGGVSAPSGRPPVRRSSTE